MTSKNMFGCQALWANENVFALVWKHGHIGVKLPSEANYQKLMEQKGAAPWKAGRKIKGKALSVQVTRRAEIGNVFFGIS